MTRFGPARRRTLTPGNPVTLSWDNGAGLTFEIDLSVDDNYMFSVQQSVKNATGHAGEAVPVGAHSPRLHAGGRRLLHPVRRPVRRGRTARCRRPTYAKAKCEGEKKDGIAYSATATGGWAGITDKYWLTALVPDQAVAVEGELPPSSEDTATATRSTTSRQDPQTIAGRRRCLAALSHLFAGAKVVRLLDRYRGRIPHPELRQGGGFRLVLFSDQADLLLPRLAERAAREFRPGDHGVHRAA